MGEWTCPECGPGVRVDEDGCCVHCGRDADHNQKHLASLEAFAEAVRDCRISTRFWAGNEAAWAKIDAALDKLDGRTK